MRYSHAQYSTLYNQVEVRTFYTGLAFRAGCLLFLFLFFIFFTSFVFGRCQSWVSDLIQLIATDENKHEADPLV